MKDGKYRKERARNTFESTGQYSRVLTERSTFLHPLGKSRAVVILGAASVFVTHTHLLSRLHEDQRISKGNIGRDNSQYGWSLEEFTEC